MSVLLSRLRLVPDLHQCCQVIVVVVLVLLIVIVLLVLVLLVLVALFFSFLFFLFLSSCSFLLVLFFFFFFGEKSMGSPRGHTPCSSTRAPPCPVNINRD